MIRIDFTIRTGLLALNATIEAARDAPRPAAEVESSIARVRSA